MNDCISRQPIMGQEVSFYWWISSLIGQGFASWGIINSSALLGYVRVGIVLARGVSYFSNKRQTVAREAGDLWYVGCVWVSWSSWWRLDRIQVELVTTEMAEVKQVARGLGDGCDCQN